MQRGLRVITLQGAIKKSPILLSQYWKFEWLDGTIIISYFGGSNNIFTDCRCMDAQINFQSARLKTLHIKKVYLYEFNCNLILL